MRNALIALVLLTIPTLAFAQDDSWRDRRGHDDRYYRSSNMFELTPTVGYRWGGTIYADQNNLFFRDVDLASSASYALTFGIPISNTGMKLELMASRQNTNFERGGGLFDPSTNLGDVDVTYYHAGLQIPFAQSRSATPYVVVSAGVGQIDPKISNASAANRFSASAGIGVKLPLNRNVGVKLEGRGFYTNTDNNNDCRTCFDTANRAFYQGEANLGLVISF